MGMTYTGPIAPGRALTIDLANRRARYAGSDVREKITGDWFDLPPGASILRITTVPGDVSAVVAVRYRERYG
ncbi:MAG TPA: hypothetical protein PLC08_06305 [Candidatus Bipolaricaulis sp.]|nr:hypothetical protein [Candidatus Bipolaricaulis sp.]